MAQSPKESLELYIKQGKTYLQLLEKTNARQNKAKIREIDKKLKRASKKMS